MQTIGKGGGLVNPAGIAIDPALGRLYVADSKAHAIKVYTTTGEFLSEFGERGETEGKFLFPSFVAVDPKTSEIYVSDTNNFRIQVFDKDGKFIRAFGELGDAPRFFQRPKGIGLDSERHVYVVEAVFNNFQLFDEKGQVLMWVGNGGSGRGGLFLSPAGLYIDENGKVYVVDALNKRIQVIRRIGFFVPRYCMTEVREITFFSALILDSSEHQRFRHPVGEDPLLWIAGKVFEWQHGQRLDRRRSGSTEQAVAPSRNVQPLSQSRR